MRSFSKKLATVLALAAMVVTTVPAAQAKAADDFTLNKTSQILYVNNGVNDHGVVGGGLYGNVQKYDFNLKNKPSDWKNYSYKWSSSNEKVATVNNVGLATAVSVGKTDISCVITAKATGKVATTLKAAVEVKANAADVAVSNANKYDGTEVQYGDVVDLNRTMYDENGKATGTRGKYVTDYTKWVAEPAEGVEVNQNNGQFKFTEAAKPGDYKLYCYTYQSSKYSQPTATSDAVTVTLVPALNLKQTTLKKFVVNFGTAVADLKAADVTINEVVVGPSGEYRVNTMVKGVTMAADKKSATVEVFYDMKDGVKYEVTVKGYDMETLVASAGKPVAMTAYAKDVTAGQVSIGKATELAYTLIDANGVDVTTGTDAEKNKVVFNLKYVGKSGANYEMSYYAGYATFDFTEVGDYAVITAEYATGEYENNAEIKVNAPSITLYAVAKQLVTVKNVVNYTTQTVGWNNFWSADKDVVKLTQTNNLAVKVALVDGKELDITTQGQTVTDTEGVTHGYVTVETTNSSKDYVDIDAVAGAAMTLRPRKVGTAQLMVYYNVILPDGSVQKTAVAPVTIKVKEAPTLGAVNLNYSGSPATTVLSINPNATALQTGAVSIQIKDQYGKDYNGAHFLEIKGSNNAADALVGTGITVSGSNVIIDSTYFRTQIHAMNSTALDPDKISGKFIYTLKYQDNTTYAIKTNTVIVDIRGLATASVIGTDVAGYANGNIARINANDPWDAKNAKSVTFKVYDKMNSANYDLRQIQPYSTITNINTATDGYYFRIFKDGVDVTKDRLADTLVTFDGTNQVTINFSGTKTDENGKTVVSYDNVGAGTYQFILYKVEPSRYNAAVKVANPVSNATRSVTVSCDPGKYTLTGRDAVIIYNADGLVPATVSNLDLLKCFNFANRTGGKFAKNPWDRTYGGGANTETQAIFDGNYVDYVVTLNNELRKPNSVFVDYVTFYEEVETGVYASYKVDVKCFVEYRAQR